MNCLERCKACGAKQWCRVTEMDETVNSFEIGDPITDWEYESDVDRIAGAGCQHEECEVIETEYDEP